MDIYQLNHPSSLPNDRKAWILISSYCCILSLLLIVGVGKVSALFFLVGALFLGFTLYFQCPHLYLGFAWWLWLVGPFIRRVIDFNSGGLTPGHFMLTPSLVTWISILTLFKHLPRLYDKQALPFILCIISILYGFFVGIIQGNALNSNIYGVMQILGPIFFGFHIFITYKNYPSYRKTILNVFLWGVLVMGAYALFQRLVLPDWDQFYLVNIAKEDKIAEGVDSSFGLFSTAEGRQQFAGLMMAGLMLLLCQRRNLASIGATGLGYLSFLLSLARAGWLSFVVGLFVFIPSLKPRFQIRIISLICLSAILVLPLVTLEPFSTFISDRIGSFSGISEDYSLVTRGNAYNLLFSQAVSEFVGKGIGFSLTRLTQISTFDGAILPMLFWLGWIGVSFFIAGIYLVLWQVLTSKVYRSDMFASASRAIALGIFAQIGFNLIFIASLGMVFWGFLGLALAADSYQREQLHLHQSDFISQRQ